MGSRLVLFVSKGIRRLSFRMPYLLFYQKQMYVLGRNILTNKRPSENYFHFQTACSILNLFRLNLRMRQSASRSKPDCGRHTLHLSFDTRPEFVFADERQWEDSFFAGVRMRPFAGYVGCSVRSVDQRIVFFRPFAALDFQHFLFDLFQAAMKRSSSALLSLSVGSIISVPATGKETVGAWKP